MSLTITEKISLDFYNPNIVVINAKQLDANSRYVNVTCTDYGKRVPLSSDEVTAFICGKKTDGTYIFNYAEILEDGTVLAELTPQILATSGRHTFDIVLLANSTLTEDEVNGLENLNDLFNMEQVTVISVMPFYVNVIEGVDRTEIESSSEFNALLQSILIVNDLERTVTTKEADRVAAEEIRKANETERLEIFGDSDDTVVDGTVYGVFNSTNQLYEEATVLVGEKTDDSTKDTLYGIKKATIENEAVRQENYEKLSADCEQALEDAKEIIKSCESLLEYSTATVEEVKEYLNI